ncbi:MAG TPA: ParB/RepB/Spo0J family partition protein [Acidobacteriota bacterium]|jgi:hypothetical protein|nr:ParB/RepB/Spo0J family partition protein [Acidobacteriota bacterium]
MPRLGALVVNPRSAFIHVHLRVKLSVIIDAVTFHFQHIDLNAILPDEDFRISFHADDSELQGIQQFGIVQPLILVADEGAGGSSAVANFRVICGFRRLQAARGAGLSTVPAMICKDLTQKQAVLLSLLERLSHGPMNAVERARSLRKFTANGWSRRELIQNLFPLLGMKFNEMICEQLDALLELPAHIQLRVARGEIYLHTAHRLSHWAPHQSQIGQWFADLKLGANKQRELLDLMDEVTRAGKMEREILIQELEERRKNPKPLEVYGAWLHYLKTRRYPQLSQVQREFEQNRARFRLPGQIQLSAPPFFEENRYQVTFPFQSREELKRYSRKLLEIADMPELEAILKLI